MRKQQKTSVQDRHQAIQKLVIAIVSFISGLITGIGFLIGFDMVISSIFTNNWLRLTVLTTLVILFLAGFMLVRSQTTSRS